MSIITTFDDQCRALTSSTSTNEDASRFIVGTLSPSSNNLLYVFEYKEDNNNLAKVSFKFPYGEVWHLSTSDKYPNLVAAVTADRGEFDIAIYKLPDELGQLIEDDYGFSDSSVIKQFNPLEKKEEIVRLSQWHPEDGYQLLTCNDGNLTIWDIEQEKEVRGFSLVGSLRRYFESENDSPKSTQISDLRWSSLFDCSVVAAAIGNRVCGIDTRIPDSSPSSICWLIEDLRCNRIRSIDFNPNSQYYIASGGDDCQTKFWDLRSLARPALQMQNHSHWIWSIRYNPFHDQLVLSAGSDSRVILTRAQSVASDPYNQIAEDDDEVSEERRSCDIEECGDKSDDNLSNNIRDPNNLEANKDRRVKDEVIGVYDEHDDSIYAAEWATDPWIFASLGFESRLIINRVPKEEMFSILF